MKQYDIFISYRRSSYDTANLIATRLKSAGYSVFFDMETLRSGKFNEQLYDAIDNCKDFIVVLPPNALDRCVNEDDWVRLEVCHAMEKGKNVIPVMLNGFTWPEPMPEGMENLSDCQALTASSIEYFDLAMERLQKQYLQSKPRIPFFRLLKYASACILSLLAVIAILWGVFYILSKDVCVQYATALTKDANNVHIIAEEQYKLAKAWETFDRAFSYERDPERIAEIQDFIEERIDLAENNVKQCWTADSVEMDISTYQRFLLSLHNINAEEIAMSPVLATLYYTDFTGEQLNFLRETARNPNSLNMKQADAILKVSEHTINSYYAGILSELSTFPKSSLGAFNELSPNWIHFPIQLYKVGESQEYYENIIIVEGKLADEILRRLESLFEQMDATIEDLENKDAMLDELVEQGQMYIDSTEMKNLIAAEIEQIKKENEEELAQRRMKVEQQRESIEASKAKIEEMEREFVAMYEDLKNNCTIEENDDQWYKWGKICRMGAFLNLLVDSEKQL
ncbi:MAG: TIR domain-containing protein, partial [Bacteroidaceae bacterium]|nr:TIR domain-containing protein [Bacteroidaceae bacterium]